MDKKLWIIMGCVLLAIMVALTAFLITTGGRRRITVVSGDKYIDSCPRYAKPGDTLQDRICAYLKACGVTEEEIEKVRAIMLERPADVK